MADRLIQSQGAEQSWPAPNVESAQGAEQNWPAPNVDAGASGDGHKRGRGKNVIDEIPDTEDQQVLWEHFQNHTDFFSQIKIDRDSGFDEIHELWSVMRLIMGVVAIFFFIFNIYAIVTFNIDRIRKQWDAPDDEKVRFFFLSSYLADFIISPWYKDGVDGIYLVALMELITLLVMLIWAVWNFTNIFNPLQTERKKYHFVAKFFFDIYPLVASLSMVKLLNFVTPQVLVPQLLWNIERATKSVSGPAVLVFFVVSRLVSLFAGFDAFLFKFQGISQDLMGLQAEGPDADANRFEAMYQTFMFVNQMLGIVQLGWFTKQRLFVFIFAGEDGAMTEKERVTKDAWEAMVCLRTYEYYGIFKAVMIWLTFSDSDFQKMVLDSRGEPAPTEPAPTDPKPEGMVSVDVEDKKD